MGIQRALTLLPKKRNVKKMKKTLWNKNTTPTGDFYIIFFDTEGKMHIGWYEEGTGFIEQESRDIYTNEDVEKWAGVEKIINALKEKEDGNV